VLPVPPQAVYEVLETESSDLRACEAIPKIGFGLGVLAQFVGTLLARRNRRYGCTELIRPPAPTRSPLRKARQGKARKAYG
jgi:hypothetical protein